MDPLALLGGVAGVNFVDAYFGTCVDVIIMMTTADDDEQDSKDKEEEAYNE